MKTSTYVLIAASAALTSCSNEPAAPAPSEAPAPSKPMAHDGHAMKMQVSPQEAQAKREAAEMLVARFEVQECQNAQMIGKVRRTQPNGGQVILRAFETSAPCAKAMLGAVQALGYAQDEPDIFAGQSPQGAAERILIDRASDGSSAIIEWEVDER